MNWLELVAALLTLASVSLAVRENVWTWPVGVVSVVLYAIVFWLQSLHALAGLQVVFLVTQIYGWVIWSLGTEAKPVPIRRSSLATGLGLVFLGVVGTVVMALVLTTWPPPMQEGQSPSPLWRVSMDAGLTAFSLVAQWMLARKLLENWLLWLAIDVVSVGFFLVDGLYFSTGLYAILGVLCVLGWQRWRREGTA